MTVVAPVVDALAPLAAWLSNFCRLALDDVPEAAVAEADWAGERAAAEGGGGGGGDVVKSRVEAGLLVVLVTG